MITWFFNVVTGRFHHWNVANNAQVNDLVVRARQFPPSFSLLFVQFASASYLVVDFLVGPDHGRKRIIKKNVKRISPEQFRALHHLNIWAFTALFGYQNPSLRESLFAACDDFIGLSENEKHIVNQILKMERIDAGRIGSPLFDEIVNILNYDIRELGDWVPFVACFTEANYGAMEIYEARIRELNETEGTQHVIELA